MHTNTTAILQRFVTAPRRPPAEPKTASQLTRRRWCVSAVAAAASVSERAHSISAAALLPPLLNAQLTSSLNPAPCSHPAPRIMPPKKPEPVAAEPVVEAPVDPTASDERVRVRLASLLHKSKVRLMRAAYRLRVFSAEGGAPGMDPHPQLGHQGLPRSASAVRCFTPRSLPNSLHTRRSPLKPQT